MFHDVLVSALYCRSHRFASAELKRFTRKTSTSFDDEATSLTHLNTLESDNIVVICDVVFSGKVNNRAKYASLVNADEAPVCTNYDAECGRANLEILSVSALAKTPF